MDPRVTIDCVIKELDGKELFSKPHHKNIQKNRDKIFNEVKFLLRVRKHPNFVKLFDFQFEDIPLRDTIKEQKQLEEAGGNLAHLNSTILMEKIEGMTLNELIEVFITKPVDEKVKRALIWEVF